MACDCQIIPDAVLERLAKDAKLSSEQRKSFADTALIDEQIRRLRAQAGKLTAVALSLRQVAAVAAATPAITVADCNHGQSLPGTPIQNPQQSADATVKRAAVETKAVADFFKSVFDRNSIDNAG